MAFSFTEAPCEVRPDIGEAHRAAWSALAKPGTWWTGAERVAIADEVRRARRCAFCAARRSALSPYTFAGEHEHAGVLAPMVVDAVHRIVTDQSRITRDWVVSLTEAGVSAGHYVEVVGVVVLVVSIDEFGRALGVAPEPLPTPMPGEPSGYVPANLEQDTGFVPMIAPGGATGAEANLWPGPAAANVLRALSLVPDAYREWVSVANAQYLPMDPTGMGNFDQPDNRALNRMQIELIAGRVSAINECFY